MKFVFYNQCELCADTMIDILESEKIPYRITARYGLYDITINSTFEQWLFVQHVAVKRLKPYVIAEKAYRIPTEYVTSPPTFKQKVKKILHRLISKI